MSLAIAIDQNKLRRLAWARSKALIENQCHSMFDLNLKSYHLSSRVFSFLQAGGLTEDIEMIFEKTSFFSATAFQDFQVHNKVGYFLKIFDQMLEQHEIDPEMLRKKLAEGRRSWHVIMREMEILRKRLSE